MISGYLDGLEMVLQLGTLLAIAGGTLLGIIMGALPGLTSAMAIALLLPVTFGMPPVMGIGMLLGALCGAGASGSIPAILLNIPGTPSSVATTFDGFPMAQKGEAGRALGLSIVASFFGGVASMVILSLLAPPIAEFALRFGAAEYFSLSIFGLVIIASVAGKSLMKGLIAGLLGFFASTIGTDPITGVGRFTFDQLSLLTGINLLPALIGLFAVSQVLKDAFEYDPSARLKASEHRVDIARPRFLETLKHWRALMAGILSGSIVGPVPGAGGSIASLVAYDQARRFSKSPDKFGTGHAPGIVSVESANNALLGGALIPTLALGIPGEAATAVLLGGLMIQGITPGPMLFDNHDGTVYGIFLAYLVANAFMLLIMCLGIKVFIRVLMVPRKQLLASILVFCFIGVYGVDGDTFNLYLMLGFGVLGYFLNRYNFGTAPVILGLILGPIAESNLRRGLQAFQGDWTPFFTRPISLTFLIIALLLLVITILQNYRARRPA
ncbi:tripartite tricarboxylate transporter permease [Larsenimonas suaedae]|uniref:Tripartite tricarboxylate transporter permease n=1 Tax=Larsenimonas suaedae TaxID=1851019 RepID=A0ABU1GSM5_9GAMM|nr:tripartite tricarboxylate transporter permease [Larsenimonas suaedae]MCM2972220.1 tripartite tricarboxylate transporter permease [Larsenimonas suaedae]MDR5894984.1 tripartite tricarboxylate transporter permease [Larsenimonas suaedae]